MCYRSFVICNKTEILLERKSNVHYTFKNSLFLECLLQLKKRALKNEFKYGVVISQQEKILPLKFFLNTDTLYSLCCTKNLWHQIMQIIISNHSNLYLSFKESWIQLEFKASRWVCYILFQLLTIYKAPLKRAQHCWPTTPNVVGCYMLRPFAHPVVCCWMLLRVVGSCHIRLHTTANKDATTPNIALLAACTQLKNDAFTGSIVLYQSKTRPKIDQIWRYENAYAHFKSLW